MLGQQQKQQQQQQQQQQWQQQEQRWQQQVQRQHQQEEEGEDRACTPMLLSTRLAARKQQQQCTFGVCVTSHSSLLPVPWPWHLHPT
jgi:hypothetical protein